MRYTMTPTNILLLGLIYAAWHSTTKWGCYCQSRSYIDKLYYGCADGSSKIGRCLKDPCEPGLICQDNPSAKCFTNLCNVCTAKWWIGSQPVRCHKVEKVNPKLANTLPILRRLEKKQTKLLRVPKTKKITGAGGRDLKKRPTIELKRANIHRRIAPKSAAPTLKRIVEEPVLQRAEPETDYQGSKLYFGCTDDSSIEYCLEDPCISQPSPCTNYPEAECHSNVCDSCNAKWWIGTELIEDCFTDVPLLLGRERPTLAFSKPVGLNDWQLYHGCNDVEDVTDCPTWEWKKLCPSLTAQEMALKKDLQDKGAIYDNPGCPNYPSAECYPNACSTCSVKYWFWGRPVDCEEPYGEFKARQTFANFNDVNCPDGYTCQCKGGREATFCYYDPCAVSSCHGHKNAECRSNNCGGCNAQFYVRGKRVFC